VHFLNNNSKIKLLLEILEIYNFALQLSLYDMKLFLIVFAIDLAKTAQEEIYKLKSELEEAQAVASALGREQEEKANEEAKKSEAEKTKLQKEACYLNISIHLAKSNLI
jgi:hypothetical protein